MALCSLCNTTQNGTNTKNVMLFFTVAWFATFTLLIMHLVYPPPPPLAPNLASAFFSLSHAKTVISMRNWNYYAKFGGKQEEWQCRSDEDYPHCEVANEAGSKLVPQNNPTVQFDIKSTKLLKMANFSAPYVSANAKIVELMFPYSIETTF